MKLLKLLGTRLLIEPLPQTTQSAGGIAFAPNRLEKQPIGHVRMIGTPVGDAKRDDLLAQFTIGDLVQVNHRYGSHDVLVDGKLHRIHSVDDVQVILLRTVGVDLAAGDSESVAA